MKVLYSRSSAQKAEDQRYQNPRHFQGIIDGATEVVVDGDYPEIERAYAAAGVKVIRTDGLAVEATPAKPLSTKTKDKPADEAGS